MTDMRLFWQHVKALTAKEVRQILRDRSSLILGIIFPLILIVMFGQGITFDIRSIRLGIVADTPNEVTSQVTASLSANQSFETEVFRSSQEGMTALKGFDVEGLLIFKQMGGETKAQLLVDGIDAPRASSITGAVTGAIAATQTAHGVKASGVEIMPRVWFNESNNSRWYLVPGLFVIILNMSGTMLTSLVVAREWERGTMEAMLATPISPLAFLLSKTIPYFCLSMIGWTMCLLAALFWYEIPIRGSFLLLVFASAIYLIMSLGMGLVISGATRSQFVSSQMSVMVSFMPAMILSGFIFDLRSVPMWANILSSCFPAVYYLEILKTCFLTGGMVDLVLKNMVMLVFFMLLFMGWAYRQCQKRVRA